MWRTYCCTQKEKLSEMLRKYLFLLFAITASLSATADDTSNAVQARKLFDHTYNMVFGEQGSTLHYSVNLIGIMKVSGTIWYKGKKSRFAESRYLSWCDGVKDFWVDEKKKTVTLYDANSEKKDKYGSKFKFKPNDYEYSWENSSEGYVIHLNAHKGVKGIKHVKAIIDKKTRAPLFLKIKVLWFWTTVKISNFKSGNISDETFVFPVDKYGKYSFYDERGK